MAEIYYCKNEDDLKRVSMHIFNGIEDDIETALEFANICGCDYVKDDDNMCQCCELEDCLLIEHLEDKNIHKHIEINDIECELPCIICVADTVYKDERITYCSVAESKENTKYGVE